MSLCAVITGASQGIGAAIAMALASEPGARLFLLARSESRLQDVAARCVELGAHAEALPCDVTDENAVAAIADSLDGRGEPVDLLINNAGQFLEAEFLSMSPAEFRGVLDTNLVSAFIVTRAFAAGMVARKRGTIVFMGSVASIRGFPRSGAYSAAKHGLLGMARSVRMATREAGIRVTTVMPGATDSPSWDSSNVSKDRLMPAEDIAEAVLSIYRLSPNTVVEEVVLRPQGGDL